MATLYLPSRALLIWARGAWQRRRCGRRFGHFPVPDEFGYPSCGKCGSRLM